MEKNKNIPTYDFYKTLSNDSNFIFAKLEDSYNNYDASLQHRHNYFELIVFKGSGGIHEIDFNTYKIKKNTIHCVSPEQVHLLKRNKGVTGFVISFKSDFFLAINSNSQFLESIPYINNSYINPVIELCNKEIVKNIFEKLSEIEIEYHSNHEDRLIVINSYLTSFLLILKRIYSAENADSKLPLMKGEIAVKFKNLIEINFRTIKSASEYSDKLNITTGHLNDISKKEYGKTASDLIFDRVILEAKRLLYYSPMSIKEIAGILNYEDASYFSRFFKTHTKSSPEEFRNQIREKYQ